MFAAAVAEDFCVAIEITVIHFGAISGVLTSYDLFPLHISLCHGLIYPECLLSRHQTSKLW